LQKFTFASLADKRDSLKRWGRKTSRRKKRTHWHHALAARAALPWRSAAFWGRDVWPLSVLSCAKRGPE